MLTYQHTHPQTYPHTQPHTSDRNIGADVVRRRRCDNNSESVCSEIERNGDDKVSLCVLTESSFFPVAISSFQFQCQFVQQTRLLLSEKVIKWKFGMEV